MKDVTDGLERVHFSIPSQTTWFRQRIGYMDHEISALDWVSFFLGLTKGEPADGQVTISGRVWRETPGCGERACGIFSR
jgi:hypothetical protein